MFAFDEEKLVWYMSCIKGESFIHLGFPWVLSGYEEEIQEQLYRSVFGYASGPLGGKKFLQRFREEWKTQISFFLGKGFNLSFSYPIYTYQLSTKDQTRSIDDYSFQSSTEFPFTTLTKLLPFDPRYENNNIDVLKAFYSDLDFDTIFQLLHNSKAVAMVALTSRENTKYSELM